MLQFPNCKINIGLWITGKRSDGFHEIETLMMPIQLSDALEINKSVSFSIRQFGHALDCTTGQNLCEKAWRLMHERYNVGCVEIDLIKKIPSGAGLGGGSADAAFTLIMLNKLFEVGLSEIELKHLASELGSDCAFFISNRPAMARGRGELLSDSIVSLSGLYVLIIKPKGSVSTEEAYSNIIPKHRDGSLESWLVQPLETWSENIINDFEKVIFSRMPELNDIKQWLYAEGALYASMSGSGSAMYGLFKQQPKIMHPDVIYCGQIL